MDSSALLQEFYEGEVLDRDTYAALASIEKRPKLKELFGKLSKVEEKHAGIWSKLIESAGLKPRPPKFKRIKVALFYIARILLGPAFMVNLLERNEEIGLSKYNSALKSAPMKRREKALLESVISDEKGHEAAFIKAVRSEQKSLQYIESIVFGMNDGLVEVLAAISGIAAFAATNSIVVLGGFIVAVSGVLSMTGGAYLAAKSKKIVGSATTETPAREAYYTGISYFIGSLFPIAPFAIGMHSYLGIAAAALLTGIALSFASIVIAVLGGTSIRARILEMLGISFGAALLTTIIGTIGKTFI
ncbi:MAG: VIT1/CCC1 transporter family protein [Candidatus Micrarchaeia archaeon]